MSSGINSFRVFDNKAGKYTDMLQLIDCDGDLCYEDGKKFCNGEAEDDFNIEWCSGYRDNNGRWIYAGDMITITLYDKTYYTGVIFYEKSKWVFQYRSNRGNDIIMKMDELASWGPYIEICGNIHDVLEEKDDAEKI